MGNYRLDEKTIWKYFDDTYKVFVPKQLIKEFEKFVKSNKFKVKLSATYNYISDKVRKQDIQSAIIREGVDYIVHRGDKDKMVSWLKKEYKGI